MNWRSIVMLFVALVLVYIVIGLVRCSAYADIPEEQSVMLLHECYITKNLKVRGADTVACVEQLETAARLARAELRVNRGRLHGASKR